MTVFVGYLTAGLLPFLYVLLPNPVLIRWYWIHREEPVSADVQQKAERVGSWILLIAQTVIVGTVWLSLKRSGRTFAAIGLIANDWRPAVVPGILAGVTWLGFYAGLILLFRPTGRHFARHTFIRRGVAYSFSWGLCSAVVEEVWRAFCLVALAGQGAAVAGVVTSTAFALAHPQPLGRALSAGSFALFAAWLFWTTGSVWVLILAHGLVNVGTLCLIRFKARSMQFNS